MARSAEAGATSASVMSANTMCNLLYNADVLHDPNSRLGMLILRLELKTYLLTRL
jgi:hypothetical protein